MRRIEKLRLDVNKEDSFNIVNFKQNDSCDLIVAMYKDNSVLDVTDQTITFNVKKPDNTYVEQTTGITIEGNTVTIKVNEQVVTREGRGFGELTLRDANGKMTTASFLIHVGEQKVNINDLVESSDNIAILDEIREFIEQSTLDIKKFKEDALKIEQGITEASVKIDELNITVNNAKNEAIIEINSNKDILIREINTSKDNALLEINANKTEVNGLLEAVKTEANNSIETIVQTTNSSLESLNALKTDLEGLNLIAQATKTELETVKNESSSLKVELENVKQSSNETLNSLNDKIDEANISKMNIENVLQNITVITNNANSLIASLTEQNTEANANILELNPLNVEANLNIEELKALITEAKEIAIPALKAYIAEHKPAEDLTEVNAQLEELYNAVKELDIRFNSYYTKTEVDEKISNIDLTPYAKKEELTNKVDKVEGKTLTSNDFTDELKTKLEGLENADLSNYYNKLETDNKFSNYYTKTQITNELNNKVDKVLGKDLSSNDFTDELKTKLEGLENTDLSNYYNKEEIDELTSGKIGFIGNNRIPAIYKNFTPNPSGTDYIYLYEEAKSRYVILEWISPYDSESTTNTLAYLTTGSYTKYVRFYMAVSGIRNKMKMYVWDGATWVDTTLDATTGQSIYIVLKGTPVMDNIFYSTVAVSASIAEGGITKIGSPNSDAVGNFDEAIEGNYTFIVNNKDVLNTPLKDGKGILKAKKIGDYIQQEAETTTGEKYSRVYDGSSWNNWNKTDIDNIDANQTNPSGGAYVTPSMLELNVDKLRIEYGEYIVDSAKNSPYVADNTREFTDLIYLKKGGFKKVLGCMAYPDRLDFHYSLYVNINMVLVDPANTPDCIRLYMSYNPPATLWKGDPWNPTTGLKKIKYCVFGY